jgi:ABC-2 type transport system permease protein
MMTKQNIMGGRKQIKKESLIRLLVTIGIILMINYLSSFLYYRFDLTAEKRYSLSATTKKVLKGLDDVVYVKVYLDGELPAGFMRLRNSVREMLDEFRIYGKDMVQYEFIDPAAEKDPAVQRQVMSRLYEAGLQPTNLQVKEKDGGTSRKIIFPGAILSYNGIDVAVNLLKNNPLLHWEVNLNNSIQSIEFEFINMIRNLSSKSVEKIAFINGHGELDQYQTGDITKELANYYQVDRGVIGGVYGSLDDYKAVIIAKPVRPFSEADKFVIDQYLMHGGKLLWLIDPVQVSMDSLFRGTTFAFYVPLNIEDQLFRYGIRINPDLVKDIQCHVIPVNKGMVGGQPEWQLTPWYYYPLIAPQDNHIITRNLNLILFEFASVIDTVGEDPGIAKTVLLATSPYTAVVSVPAEISLRETDRTPEAKEFAQSFKPLAVLVEGEFQSVFTNRPVPSQVTARGAIDFRTASQHTKMIVMSDGDVIRNDVTMSPNGPVIGQLGADRYTSQVFGNKELILNMVNYLTDETGLMELRGREFKMRLLDKKRIADEGARWKLINSVGPVLLVILFGIVFNLLRKIKYRAY